MSQSSESNIERMRRRLDSRGESGGDFAEGKLSSTDRSSVEDNWEHDEPPYDDSPPVSDPEDSGGMSFLDKMLLYSSIFFVLAFGFAIFYVGTGGGDISPDKVSITISGPDAVSAGATVDFTVSITNQNKVSLEEAELVIIYPEGTRNPDNTGEELRRLRKPIGTITSGRTTQQTVTASLFGEQGQVRTLEIRLEYKVAESNAIFSAGNEYEIEITEAPVSITVDIPKEITPGQSFTTEVKVSSNASQTLNDVLLEVHYPFGFSPERVSPDPVYRQSVWNLGDISPGAERVVEIRGFFIEGSNAKEQTFRFNVGTAQVADTTAIGTLFAAQDEVVSLKAPFIDLGLDLNMSERSGSGNLEINGRLSWLSNLNSLVRGGEVILEIAGESVDYSSVRPEDGLYDAGTRSIVWSSQTNSELTTISPGDSGEFSFKFSTRKTQLLADIAENPIIVLTLRMQASAPDSSTLPDQVTASLQQEIRLPTVLRLAASTLHEDGPFTNTGPVPPEVDEETTYTLHLVVSNTTNEITNAQFSAALPAYVEINGSPSPSGDVFSYNEVSGRVQWKIGTIPAGAGYNTSPKELFIPVVLRPTQNHVGSELPLLEDISVTGMDTSRETTIQVDNIPVPTTQRDDLRAGDQETGKVQP
ncbi:MAG: hypothetical protein WD552_01270 [Candidatus Paceibacterota bacterium]